MYNGVCMEKAMETNEIAVIDELTGVYNHETFSKALEEQLYFCDREQSHFTVAMIDIDHFMRINKELGHVGGDEVLREVAKHLKSTTGAKGNTYRYGGDEFVVLMPGIEKGEAVLLLEENRSEFDKEHVLEID